MIAEPEVREEIALALIDRFDYLKGTAPKEISGYVKKADKDLFLKFKDGVYTLDQLKARIAERRGQGGVKYVVLDDLRGQLSERFLVPSAKEQAAEAEDDQTKH